MRIRRCSPLNGSFEMCSPLNGTCHEPRRRRSRSCSVNFQHVRTSAFTKGARRRSVLSRSIVQSNTLPMIGGGKEILIVVRPWGVLVDQSETSNIFKPIHCSYDGYAA